MKVIQLREMWSTPKLLVISTAIMYMFAQYSMSSIYYYYSIANA